MVEAKVHKLEQKLEEIVEDVIDSKQVLVSISKDMHVMSQSSIEMKDAVKKLLETEVKFQLHAQKMDQSVEELKDMNRNLDKRLKSVEAVAKIADKDHVVVEKLSTLFWKALGWASLVFGGFVVSAMIFIAKLGGLDK